jgi:hypothetical protein
VILLIVVNLILVIAVVSYVVLSRHRTSPPATGHSTQAGATAVEDARDVQSEMEASFDAGPGDDTTAAIRLAQELYQQGSYSKALAYYEGLKPRFETNQQESRLLRSYILFKSALCRQQMGQHKQVATLLGTCANGPSPVVAALANYYLGIEDAEAGRFGKARSRFYRSLAMAAAPFCWPGLPRTGTCRASIQRSMSQPECGIDLFWMTRRRPSRATT